MEGADAFVPFIFDRPADSRLRGDQLEAARELGAQEVRRCGPIGIPPLRRGTDVCFRQRSDPQTERHGLSLQVAEEFPAVARLAAVGLADRLGELRPLLVGQRNGLVIVLGNEDGDGAALGQVSVCYLKTAIDDLR